MQEVFSKYGVTLSERELVLANAAYAAGFSDAYNSYCHAIEEEDPNLVQDLKDLSVDKVAEAKRSLAQLDVRHRPGGGYSSRSGY